MPSAIPNYSDQCSSPAPEPRKLRVSFMTETTLEFQIHGDKPHDVGQAVREALSFACLDQRHGLIPESVRFAVV